MNYLCRSFLGFQKDPRDFSSAILHLSLVRRCSVFFFYLAKDSTDVFFPKLPNIKFLFDCSLDMIVIFSHSSIHSTFILTRKHAISSDAFFYFNFKQIGVLYLYWRFYWHQNIIRNSFSSSSFPSFLDGFWTDSCVWCWGIFYNAGPFFASLFIFHGLSITVVKFLRWALDHDISSIHFCIPSKFFLWICAVFFFFQSSN